GYRGQRPDRAVRRQVFGMQQPEVFGNFAVATHRIGNARSGIDAGERRADDRQKYREGFHQHEDLPVARAEERIAYYDHHVADRRGRAGGGTHRIPVVQKIVRGEIFDQIAEDALYQQRDDYRNRYVAPWVPGLAAHRSYRFKPYKNKDGDGGLDEHPAEVVNADDRTCIGMGLEIALLIGGRIRDLELDRLASCIELRLGNAIGVARNHFG